MNKPMSLIVTMLLLTLPVLPGCASKTQENGKQIAATSAPSASPALTDQSLKDGTAKLLKTAKLLRKAATAGDQAKVKELGPQLEDAWSAFEDGIKPKYPDLYKKVEESLDPAIAGTKASTLDKDAVLKLDNLLIDVLYELSAKLLPVDQIKAGANSMIAVTNDLKKEIAAVNEAKVKELAPKLEETWSTFEDGVQPRSSELYEKIENSLNPEVAGARISPLDKDTLAKLNDALAQSLNELLQTIK